LIALSNPLNLQRILCIALVIVNCPDSLLKSFRVHRLIHGLLALFRTFLAASFSLAHFDDGTIGKVATLVIGVAFFSGLQFAANWVDRLKPEGAIA
jgi:4-hydroxybenzoate polyprenyltransferase